jgi:peptidoglycan-associated lipoprotein
MDTSFDRRSSWAWVQAFFALLLSVLAGCSSTKLTEAPLATVPVTSAAAPLPSPGTGKPSPLSSVKEVVIHPLDEPTSALAVRSVFFEFDSAQVAASNTQMLTEHAKYLRAHTTAKVRVEGNTDERGGREYNLALGQKRADAVGNAFKLLGVSAAQMELTSYGKEKPTSLAHDEAAWSKDRRADIVYQARQ